MRNPLYHIVPALSMFIFLMGCGTNKPVDRDAIKQEMKDRELKRVSTSKIMEVGKQIGNAISTEAQATLQTNLLRSVSEDSIAGAVKYCNVNALQLVKGLEDSLDVVIYRVSEKYRNPRDEPDSLEALILDAYHYSAENGISMESSIQEENDQVLLYTRPIMINNPLCLQCHGKIGEDIQTADYEVINSLYPEDKAVGYELGELRGMWSIRIPKKTVINSL